MSTGQATEAIEGIPQPGETVAGKYRVERLIGVGGMGAVVAATHLDLGEPVAIKFLLSEAALNPNAVARFTREAQAAARIKSDHVARVSDVGKLDNGTPYMVMEFLEGEDLCQVLERTALPVQLAVRYVLEASEALAEAHRLGIVHRDLKPANLFLALLPDGSARVKVLDFGISKMSAGPGANLTKTSALMGSPVYMAPEQMESAKNVDARSDIWALGTILYETLTRSVAFGGDTLPEICAKILQAAPDPLRQKAPHVPPGLEAVIERMLQKRPDQRFQNLAEVAAALVPFGDGDANRSAQVIRRILSSSPASSVVSASAAVAAAMGSAPGAPSPRPWTASQPEAAASGAHGAQPTAASAGQPTPLGHAPSSPGAGAPAPPYAPPPAGLVTGPQAPPDGFQATGSGQYPAPPQAAMAALAPAAPAPQAAGPAGPGWATSSGSGPAPVVPTFGTSTAAPFSQTMAGMGSRPKTGLFAVLAGAGLLAVTGVVVVVLLSRSPTPPAPGSDPSLGDTSAPSAAVDASGGGTEAPGTAPTNTGAAEQDAGTVAGGSPSVDTTPAPTGKGRPGTGTSPKSTAGTTTTAVVKTRPGDSKFD